MHTEVMSLNVGPQHPSTHGVLRLVVDMDGEYVIKVTPHMGYLHTGFEKTFEHRTYQQGVTYAPRTDYLHSFGHELAYVLGVEKLMQAEVPERATTVRVILHELGRIHSHLVFLGTALMDLGAITLFFYCFREKEAVQDLFEEVCGYRMNQGYFRVGGLSRDIPDGWTDNVQKFVDAFDKHVDEYASMFATNPIFLDRAVGVGVIPADVAIDLGLTGPNLRASGVPLDHRKANPYCGFETYDFNVPVSQNWGLAGQIRAAPRRAARERQDRAAGPEAAQAGAHQGPQPQDQLAAASRTGNQHGSGHSPFQTGHRGLSSAAGRGLRAGRNGTRRGRLLHHLRRRLHAVPGQDSRSEFRQSSGAGVRLRGRAIRRPDHRAGHH